MSKFNADDKCFVHVATHRGQIMMVVSVRDGIVPRYDLQAKNGAVYSNIGEYELTPASDEEVKAALAA